MSNYLIGILVVVCALLFSLFKSEKNKNLFLLGEKNVYKGKSRLLSPNEMKLFCELRKATTLENCFIFPQIPYSAIIEVNPDKNDLGSRFEYINEFRADFLLTDKESTLPLLVIELNDTTHKYPRTLARDKFVYSALEDANIKYLVLEINDLVNSEILLSKIEEKMR